MGSSSERILAGVAKPPVAPFRKGNGRASFPRRMTLDLDDARFEWVRDQAWQARVLGGSAGLLRAAIDVLAADDELLARVLSEVAG